MTRYPRQKSEVGTATKAMRATSTDQCQALVEAGVEAFGQIDGLVNSAYAHGDWATADVSDPDKMGDVINVICQGALRMAQACAPHMQATGGGSIVNVSTMSTVKPFAGETMYAAGKGALNALTRHMANDFGKFSIRVNALRMGWIGGAHPPPAVVIVKSLLPSPVLCLYPSLCHCAEKEP